MSGVHGVRRILLAAVAVLLPIALALVISGIVRMAEPASAGILPAVSAVTVNSTGSGSPSAVDPGGPPTTGGREPGDSTSSAPSGSSSSNQPGSGISVAKGSGSVSGSGSPGKDRGSADDGRHHDRGGGDD